MLVYIWMCVVMQAFVPAGERLAARYVDTVQAYVRAQVESLEPMPELVVETPAPRRATRTARAPRIASAGFAR